MSKANKCYGIGQGLIYTLPIPKRFTNAPTSGDTNYEVGQLAYTPGPTATAFYIYAGAGSWIQFADSDGPIENILATAPVAVSIVGGVATISLAGPPNVTTLTNHGVVLGQGTSAVVATAVGATGTLLSGNTGADPTFTASPSVTGSITAGTTITATSGAITATNGNFVGSAAGTGLLLNSPTASGVAASPVIVNGRSGKATFTTVSIAAAADLTLTITNSAITGASTQVIYSMSGATTGSALSIKSVTNSAGSSAIVVTNGTGATTTTADIVMTFLVIN